MPPRAPRLEPVMTARPVGGTPTGRDRTCDRGQLMKEPGAQALAVTQVCDSMLLFMYTPLV